MIPRLFFLCLTLSLLTFGQYVNAVGDQFTIGINITESIPPTTPDPVSATPVASSQIDLIWGASTDNDALGGYRVFRNAAQIATTTLTTYSDTGLLPSTLYSYYIQAFDVSYNYSSTSVIAATTTLAAPTSTPTTTPPTGGNVNQTATKLTPKLTDFKIDASKTEALITFDTNLYVRYVLHWGKLSSYELGSVQSESYQRSHVTKITDLEPGTIYNLELRVYNQRGEEFVLTRTTFVTESATDVTAPANVSKLKAVPSGNDVFLTWENPTEADFAYVRIVRNYRFYPLDPGGGYIAYQGSAASFNDLEALAEHNLQYYTVFSYDRNGNVSSGAVTLARLNSKSGDITNNSLSSSSPIISSSTNPIDKLPPPLIDQYNVDFSTLRFWQNDVLLQAKRNIVTGSSAWTTLVHLPYESAPPHLKTILFSLGETSESDNTYLMRINKDSTGYETLLPALKAGTYPVTLSVFDYQTNAMSRVTGTLVINDESKTTLSHHWNFEWDCWWCWLIIVLVVLVIYLLMRRILD